MAGITLKSQRTYVSNYKDSLQGLNQKNKIDAHKKTPYTQLFHYPQVRDGADRGRDDLIQLGLTTHAELERAPKHILEAIATLHVARAMGLSVDAMGNTIHESHVDGIACLTWQEINELTPNEIECISYECETAAEVLSKISLIRDGSFSIGTIELEMPSTEWIRYV